MKGCKTNHEPQVGVVKNSYLNTLEVHPNPADNKLSVNLVNYTNIAYVHLYDSQGRLVIESTNLSSGIVYIPSENTATGLYMLEVSADNEYYSQKVLIK